jgi:transcriptional regulator with XRE-family HTH domain
MNNIAERLKKIRLKEHKSQEKMAEALGVSQRSWSDYENGKSDVPVQVVMKLESYGYSLNWILKGGESSDIQSPSNEFLKIEIENKSKEIETLKKENAECSTAIKRIEAECKILDAKNRAISDELIERLRQLVDVQNGRLATLVNENSS